MLIFLNCACTLLADNIPKVMHSLTKVVDSLLKNLHLSYLYFSISMKTSKFVKSR